MAITSVTDRYKKYQNTYKPQLDSELKTIDNIADNSKSIIQKDYENQIQNTKNQYADEFKTNLVQKYVNEKQIRDNMSDIGLTDSGLNRTQQTAVQLSYSNNQGKIQRQMDEAVNAFVLAMTAKLGDVETQRANDKTARVEYYNGLAMTDAQNEYETDVAAETSRQNAKAHAEADIVKYKNDYNLQKYKAQLTADTNNKKIISDAAIAKYKADLAAKSNSNTTAKSNSNTTAKSNSNTAKTNLINTSGQLIDRSKVTGSLKDSNIQVVYDKESGKTTYLDLVTGKKTTLNRNQNPFTGTVNKDTENGTFSNGYQPDNINDNKLKESGYKVNGQNLWKYTYKSGHFTTTKYAVWDGEDNCYYGYTAAEAKAAFPSLKNANL